MSKYKGIVLDGFWMLFEMQKPLNEFYRECLQKAGMQPTDTWLNIHDAIETLKRLMPAAELQKAMFMSLSHKVASAKVSESGRQFLSACEKAGIKLYVLSDYCEPATAALAMEVNAVENSMLVWDSRDEALGIARYEAGGDHADVIFVTTNAFDNPPAIYKTFSCDYKEGITDFSEVIGVIG